MTHKPLMVVGEAWGEQEELQGKPLVGPAGSVFHGLLRQVGIDKSDIYITNVLNFRPRGNRLDSLYVKKPDAIPGYRPISNGKYMPASILPEIERLFEEIDRIKPNLILALGNTPLWALCKKSGIKRYRGSPLLTHDQKYKVLPTWHPAAILRQWELRAICLADYGKAKREMTFPELNRPSHKIYLEPTIADIAGFYEKYLRDQPFLSCDIETKNQTITEVGYATADGSRCIVIPFWDRQQPDGNYWRTFEEEKQAWNWVRRINSEKPLIGQNFAYDMQYFWRTMGIPCPHFAGDTMLMHHSMQPEMEKGLGFLGSIYTNEPSWKFMRTDHSTLKREDD